MTRTITLESPQEMQQFAQALAARLRGGMIVRLIGELGSGKTRFTQAVAAALGVTVPVPSPTFLIASEYKVSEHPSIRRLLHFDLYRLDQAAAATDPAVRDALVIPPPPDALVLIEWAEKLGTLLGAALTLTFRHGSGLQERIIELDATLVP